MRATPAARAFSWSVDFLDRFWGLIGFAVVVGLEVFVFGPRGMVEWMIGAGVVGAGIVVAWVGMGASRWQP
jgi:multisubunit Na+/H+ antiporter MnhC subunit